MRCLRWQMDILVMEDFEHNARDYLDLLGEDHIHLDAVMNHFGPDRLSDLIRDIDLYCFGQGPNGREEFVRRFRADVARSRELGRPGPGGLWLPPRGA